jgi:broad-specificity NMP kinase
MNATKKKLIIINGTMGIGKTTVCQNLYQKIQHCVWLDGDWCWMMNPWNFSEENKRMVEKNITFLLRSYLTNPNFDYVIFSWVIHTDNIFNIILDRLKDLNFKLKKITLICSEEALRERMRDRGENEHKIKASIQRLHQYSSMDTDKVDTTNLSESETVDKILSVIL